MFPTPINKAEELSNYHSSVDDPIEQDSIEERRGIIMQCGSCPRCSANGNYNNAPTPRVGAFINNYPHHQKKFPIKPDVLSTSKYLQICLQTPLEPSVITQGLLLTLRIHSNRNHGSPILRRWEFQDVCFPEREPKYHKFRTPN